MVSYVEMQSSAATAQREKAKSSVHGIVLFGTPHAGSDFAAIADTAARLVRLIVAKQPNSYILDVLNRNSAMLANIENDFSKLVLRRIKELQEPIRCQSMA